MNATTLSGIVFALAFAAAAAGAAPLTPIATDDFEALLSRAEATLDAVAEVDANQARGLREAMSAALAEEVIPSRKSLALQRVLDTACALEVAINPESRVKVAPGPAGRELVEGVWRTYLVKVHNVAAVMSPLRVLSDQRAGDARDQWLEIELHNGRALPEELTGGLIEYRVVRLRTDEVGYRAAVIAMDVGQGTADIGFRNDTLMTFRCERP